MEYHLEEEEEDDPPIQGKRQGMQYLTTFPPSFQSNQRYSKMPRQKSCVQQSTQTPNDPHAVNSMRDVSVSTALSKLNIDEGPPQAQGKEHQAISSSINSTAVHCHKASISTGLRNLKLDGTERSVVLFQPPEDSLVAPTPSKIPVFKPEAVAATPATPSRTPKTCPHRTQFLSKDSNISTFTAWNVVDRMETMESMFEELKDTFSGTTAERAHLEEAMGLYKARSEFISH